MTVGWDMHRYGLTLSDRYGVWISGIAADATVGAEFWALCPVRGVLTGLRRVPP